MATVFETKKKNKIVLPINPYMLRINKKAGCFAIGVIEDGDIASIQTNGRGKWVEGFLVNVDTDLFGSIGKTDNRQWAFVSLLLTAAMDSRLPAGVLVHFPLYGFEADFFSKLQVETELAEIFGSETDNQILRIEFNKPITTQYGSTIRPPVPTFRDATPEELDYLEAVDVIHKKHPNAIPDPLAIPDFMPVHDDKTGELVKGLVRLSQMQGASPITSQAQTITGQAQVASLPAS